MPNQKTTTVIPGLLALCEVTVVIRVAEHDVRTRHFLRELREAIEAAKRPRLRPTFLGKPVSRKHADDVVITNDRDEADGVLKRRDRAVVLVTTEEITDVAFTVEISNELVTISSGSESEPRREVFDVTFDTFRGYEFRSQTSQTSQSSQSSQTSQATDLIPEGK